MSRRVSRFAPGKVGGVRTRGQMGAAVAAVLVVSACAGTRTSPPQTAVMRSPSATPPAAARASEAQRQAAFHHVDVDGDGRLDSVELQWVKFTDREVGRGMVRLTVHLASGKTVRTNLSVFGWTSRETERPVLPWFGATRLLRQRSQQLVLGYDDSPASAVGYQVIAFRQGGLVRIPALPGSSDPYEWFAHQSGVGENGFTCTDVGVDAISIDPNGRKVTDAFRWRGTGWAGLAHHVAHVDVRAAGLVDWQHCPGLPETA